MAHPIFPIDSSAQAFYGHQQQQNPAIHNNILNGTMTHTTVDPLETTSLCQNLGIQLPPLNAFNEGASQVLNFSSLSEFSFGIPYTNLDSLQIVSKLQSIVQL